MAIRRSQIEAKKRRNFEARVKKLGRRATLTKGEVEEIRRLFLNEDWTTKKLTREFTVSLPTIYKVLNGIHPYEYEEDRAICPQGHTL